MRWETTGKKKFLNYELFETEGRSAAKPESCGEIAHVLHVLINDPLNCFIRVESKIATQRRIGAERVF